MEQLKQSEDKIIKLGKKLVKELDLEYSVNTLARWMSHYLAELMCNIDNAKTNEEKKDLQKECCDLILKLWSQKENLPIRKPLDDLKPMIEILQVLQKEKELSILPWHGKYNRISRDSNWASFADMVKDNSEKIFNKVIQMNLHKDILSKDEEWMKENKEFLTEDQIHFFELIDVFASFNSKEGSVDLNNTELSDDNKQRIKFVFDELEKLIDEQKKELQKIKHFYNP